MRQAYQVSYGYRPGRSALDAVAACRERCWRKDWVVDLDVQKFFDSVPWDLVIKAVEANTDLPWVVLYVRRWSGFERKVRCHRCFGMNLTAFPLPLRWRRRPCAQAQAQ